MRLHSGRPSSRHPFLIGLVAIVAAGVLAPTPVVAIDDQQGDDPAAIGEWGTPIQLPAVAIHSTLLPGGRVLMFVWPSSEKGSEAWIFDPESHEIADVSLHRRRDLFCSGHSLMSDGRVLVAGGTEYGQPLEKGVRETEIFDPDTGGWSKGPDMEFKRWYPTTLALADGRTLIVSGQRGPGHLIAEMETFDPVSETMSTLPRRAAKRFETYPSLHVLPDGRVLKTINETRSRFLDPETSSWSRGPWMKTGWRGAGNSILLPGLDRVMVIGGGSDFNPKRSTEILDLSAATPHWRFGPPMRHRRVHSNGVLLADGTVLVVGGNGRGEYGKPVKVPELFDPVSGTWTTMAAQRVQRGYHSTAILLADGSVLSAGSDHGPRQKTAEIFKPPYLFRGPRPTIEEAPAALGYGETFSVSVEGEVARVALVRPGASTHAVIFDQRYVDLEAEVDGSQITASSPATPSEAPPGWYMLFALSAEGVPSEAAWVQVGV